MKILKIFGIVVGIHLFALILIFANPGCSSTSKPPPSPADTIAKAEPTPSITLPVAAAAPAPTGELLAPPPAAAPASFNPDAPATYGASGSGVRFMPTRPNTPAASAVLSQPVENVTPATTYTVKSGDSLWTLQKKFHIDYKTIAAANNLKSSATLHEGQKLIIPSKTPTASASAPAATASTSAGLASSSSHATTKADAPSAPAAKGSGEEVKYIVKPGESLGAIAKKFDVKVRDLATRNNISEPKNLRAGTEIVIPGWKSTSGASSKASTIETAKAPAPAPVEKPAINVIDTEAAPAANNVPVIKIDDGSSAPASKQP